MPDNSVHRRPSLGSTSRPAGDAFNRIHRLISQWVLVTFLVLWLPGLVWAQAISSPVSNPNDGWQVGTLRDANLDPAAIAELVEMIDTGRTVPNVHALLIEHSGRLVFEQYWPGTDRKMRTNLGRIAHGTHTLHDIRSISKSVTSLLMGIALGDSASEALNRPIASFFPDRTDLNDGLDDVTLHHVLTMRAGLAWNETIVPYDKDNDFVRLLRAADPVGFVLSKQLRDKPGTKWNYNSGLTDLTAGVVEGLTGQPLTDFAEEALFGPLGITEYEWWRPDAWPEGRFPSAGAGLRLKARDLAKIGSLILHGGQWNGRQIVPKHWIDKSTYPHVQNRWGKYDYGYFWLPGKLVSGHQTIVAMGWGDQRIFVLPEIDMVITFTAGNYDTGGGEIADRITGRILRAMQ